jgi:hypothetical protein
MMPLPSARPGFPRLLSGAAGALVLSGCTVFNLPSLAPGGATTPPRPAGATTPPAGPAAAASVPAAMVPAPRPEPSPLRAFAEIVKDAKEQPGYLGVWRKDDRVWLEIPAERLGQPMLLSASVAGSVGERGLYASQMGPSWMVELRRIGNVLQVVAKNTDFRALTPEPALQRTVRQGFSDSLLASTLVLSLPHPQRKSVLVDANFLLSDIPGYSTALERAYRLPYGLDRANSYFDRTRAEPALTTLSAAVHFATPRIPAPPLVASPVPMPGPPGTTPDPRSLFVGFVYSFMPLPALPMTPRLADARIGHFTEAFTDLGSDFKANPRVHYVQRWRLEKKDPAAEQSEPVKPITFWLDANIPKRYRAAVEAGILEWNKAFDRIGFRNAIVVRQQADDDDFDTMDAGRASIRWFTGADAGFARGPSHTDPRSGEILDADIALSDVFARGSRRFYVEDLGAHPPMPGALAFGGRHQHSAACFYADAAAEQMQFALDLLATRGDIAPDSPEAEAFVQAVIKDTIMHEVGHTLGLKHNFKASTTVTRAQLQDKAWTEANGISGSVMDYNAYNLALQGERQGARNNTTLGAYDYWAIEYAYKPIHPDHEAAELARIAARSREPALAFADDGDAYAFSAGGGIDPLANIFDLGDDPLAYYRKRLALSKELWQRVQARPRAPGEDPLRQRRSLLAGFRQVEAMPPLAAKYVGGMYTVRDASGREPTFRPVEPARQREALRFLAESIFSVDSFRFKPEFLAGMGPDYIEWQRAAPVSIPSVVLRMQAQTLDRLLAGGTAQRLIDLPGYLPESERRGALSLNELYGTLQQTVWSELKSGREIELMRRNLQREHLRRVQALIVRGAPGMPADAASLLRLHATQLQAQLRDAQARSAGLSVETRAHLQESYATLTEALRATMQRS